MVGKWLKCKLQTLLCYTVAKLYRRKGNSRHMRLHFWKQHKTNISYSLYLKCGAILFLFTISVLIVACGGTATNANLGQPDVTVTINLNQSDGSPTPPLPAYTCSAWVTNTTPNINNGTGTIGIYAKFVHNVNGNPEGVYPASGHADVLWPDGNPTGVNAQTTSDGLAVFPVSIANRNADLNKIVLVTVSFTGPQGVPPCTVTVDRAAFFTLIIASPTAGGTPGASPTAGSTGTVTDTPTVTPSPTVDPTPDPKPCPSPKPFKTPTPCP